MSEPRASRRGRRLAWVGAGVAVLASAALSVWLVGSPPPRRIRLATGDPEGAFAVQGQRYKARLERMGLHVDLVESSGSLENLSRLRAGEVEAAFVQGGLAGQVDEPHPLCALAAVGSEPLWAFAGPKVASLGALRGQRVAVGPKDSGTEVLAVRLLAEYGITPDNTRFVNLAMAPSRQALLDGKIDAALIVCGPDAPVIRRLCLEQDKGVRLLSLPHARAVVRRLPYLRAVELPRGVFDLRGNAPPEDVVLAAPVTLLAAREDLHPRVVELLLAAAQPDDPARQLLGESGRFPSLRGTDLPPHFAAERFMRSGESFLSRLLSYRAIRLFCQAQLLVLPLLALLPLWKALPFLVKLRFDRIIDRHYRALADVEKRIDQVAEPVALEKLLGEVEGLRQAMEKLSRKLSGVRQREVYTWRLHVALVRDEARARLRQLAASSPCVTDRSR
jgi:TRAP transporter TAXI family solute receptor